MTIITPSIPALLQLMRLASPALPIGGFSYSEGLESAIDMGHVKDQCSCQEWLIHQLLLTQARGDMAVIAQAIPAWKDLDQARLKYLSSWVWATRESAEMILQTDQMGRSLLQWMRNLGLASDDALNFLSFVTPSYAMTYALALSCIDVSIEQALQTYAFGWAENMTQAAIKAIPLGQNSGQHILHNLMQVIPKAVKIALDLNDETRQAFSPMLAIISSRHEHQYSRLFRS